MKNTFIMKIAADYNVLYSEIEVIYNKWNVQGLFYEKLQEYMEANRCPSPKEW